MKAKEIPGVARQKRGSYHDTESCKVFEISESAAISFEILKNRFLNINHWKHNCKENSA